MRLRSRLIKLERRSVPATTTLRDPGCNCRNFTDFHNEREVQRMRDKGCPVHGTRDLGNLFWRVSWLPLDLEDREVCDCPPNLWREFLEGKRPRPTEEKIAESEREQNARRS